MITPTSISEQLLFSTIRIETKLNSGKVGTGTGFFFNFKLDEQRIIPTIITNKHVVKNATAGNFYLHEADAEGKKPSTNNFAVNVGNFEQQWVMHPSEEVDLCVMPFQPLIIGAKKLNKFIFNRNLDESLILNDIQLEDLNAVEEVLMIGYPIGLWDSTNNLPIIRRGVTATHPAIDFCGKSISVVDIACFPGSSGSPVILVNEGFYGTKKGTSIGNRAVLLGVLYAGPQIDAEGNIETETIPTAQQAISHTKIMVNLGYIIKAREIKVLGEILKKRVLENEQNNSRV